MKYYIWLPTLLLVACTNKEHQNTNTNGDTINADTLNIVNAKEPQAVKPANYSNARFKEVTVEKVGDTTYRIKGQGQIFEANFNWVIEDGHDQLKKGFQMTDAGAPEWGNFDFIIDIEKKRENSTLTLILFETSAEDGSHVHELPILLE